MKFPQVDPPPFDTADPLLVDALIGSDERAVRDTVRTFCDEVMRPQLPGWVAEQRIAPVRELASQLGKLGVLTMDLGGDAGGGLSSVDSGFACLELESCDASIRAFAVHTYLAMFALDRFGDADQQRTWLPRLASGEVLGCYAENEVLPGHVDGVIETTAERAQGGWVLNGRKRGIVLGADADLSLVWAATDEGVRAFLVPAHTPGFTACSSGRTGSLRESLRAELRLEGVRLPATAVLPGSTDQRARLRCLLELRYSVIWGVLGAARSAFHHVLDRSRTRPPRVARSEAEHTQLVTMAVELNKALLLAVHLGKLKESGLIRVTDLQLGKISNTQVAQEVCQTALTLLPADGAQARDVRRHLANLESMTTSEYATNLDILALSEALTDGVPTELTRSGDGGAG